MPERNGIIFYRRWHDVLKNLSTDEEERQMYNAIFNYGFFGEIPKPEDCTPLVYSIFGMIKNDIDYDNDEWAEVD